MNKILGVTMFVVGLCCASCSDDDESISYSQKPIANSELKTILMQKGYQFSEDGKLLLDDLANNTTTLDLSGTNITDLSELDILPNLKEVDLSDNGYGPAFDFSQLPTQITGIDLTGNEIYDYDNLINVVTEENGDETITNLHTITKLYLPAEAKENTKQLPRFYRQNKEAITSGAMDVQMEDEQGSLQTYNTLRTIPDEVLRNYLKGQFPKYFDGDKIDLERRDISGGASLPINFTYRTHSADGCTSLEGIQYIVEHPYWEGTTLQIEPNEVLDCPSLKVGPYVTLFQVANLNVEEIDLTGAESVTWVQAANTSGFKRIDLSANPIWGQRDIDTEEDSGRGSSLLVWDCPSLKEILLPNVSGLRACNVVVEVLNSLETFDLTKFKMIRTLAVGDLPDSYDLVYPDLTEFNTFNGLTYFACSEKTNELQSTIDFVEKYYKGVSTSERKLGISMSMHSDNNKAARWYR